MLKLYKVAVNRDDTVRVISIEVLKETPQFYITNAWKRGQGLKWDDPFRRDLQEFGTSDRTPKDAAFTSARAALEHYMQRRQRDKSNAQAVIAQATKQIASANELLMKEPPPVDAVDPVGERVTG